MNKFNAHILVVDDDDGIRSLVTKYLDKNNFLVTTAISAENAAEKVKIIKLGNRSATAEGRIYSTDNKLVATLLHSAQPVDRPPQ